MPHASKSSPQRTGGNASPPDDSHKDGPMTTWRQSAAATVSPLFCSLRASSTNWRWYAICRRFRGFWQCGGSGRGWVLFWTGALPSRPSPGRVLEAVQSSFF